MKSKCDTHSCSHSCSSSRYNHSIWDMYDQVNENLTILRHEKEEMDKKYKDLQDECETLRKSNQTLKDKLNNLIEREKQEKKEGESVGPKVLHDLIESLNIEVYTLRHHLNLKDSYILQLKEEHLKRDCKSDDDINATAPSVGEEDPTAPSDEKEKKDCKLNQHTSEEIQRKEYWETKTKDKIEELIRDVEI